MFNKKAPCVYVNQQSSVFDPDLWKEHLLYFV